MGFSNVSLELLSKAEGVGYINSQLSQLSHQLQQLLTDRVSLLHQLNDLQSRDVILPDETLSTIFVKAHEDPDKPVSPIVLGAVCSRWRRIAWDTPLLWSTIGTIPRRPIRQSDMEMLRLYFQNTAQHPLHLDLRLDRLPPKRRTTRDFLAVIFVEHPLKVQKITLSTTSSPTILTMIERAIERSNLSNLSTLAFVARDNGSIPSIPPLLTTFFHSAINLRTLIVDSYRFPCIERISQSPITILKLRNIPINQCLDALLLCPAMKEFYCDRTRPADKEFGSVVHSMKELRNLEIFDVELRGPGYFDESWISNSLFLHFRFPNLKHMAWGGTFAGTAEHELTSFLSAMKSIIIFECRSFHNEVGLELIFQSLSPTVRTVYMPSLSDVPEICLRLLKLISNAVVPNLQGMRSLELAFPYYHPVFTFDLRTIKEDLCEKGVHLEISEIPR